MKTNNSNEDKLYFDKFSWDEPVNEDLRQQKQNWKFKLKSN